jgi:hypothetical protein
LGYSPWVIRNWHGAGRIVVLDDREDTIAVNAHLTAGFIRQGMELHAAREATVKLQGRLATAAQRVEPPGRLSTVYWRDVGQRLAILFGLHPRVMSPFPLTGTTTHEYPVVRLFTYAWHVVMYPCALAALIFSLRGRDLRLFSALALPGALILTYALIHGIPRYQIVPFSGLTIAAGVSLGLASDRMPRSLRRTGRIRDAHQHGA